MNNMEIVYKVTLVGLIDNNISFTNKGMFLSYPTEKELQDFYEDFMKDKSVIFKKQFNWQMSIDKVYIPKQ